MEYFSVFPTILYTFDPAKYDYRSVVNIFARTKILDQVLNNSLVYYKYNMKETDTAEIIASKYYGDTKRHWIVFYANQVVDPYFDLPLKTYDLEQNIILKYGSLANAQATLHHVNQFVNVTTTYSGTSNTQSYVSTLNEPYTYDFSKNMLVSLTLPTTNNPVIEQSNTQVLLSDGTLVTTVTTLVAVSCYDYEVQQNEDKRQIQILEKQYASSIEQEFKKLLSN